MLEEQPVQALHVLSRALGRNKLAVFLSQIEQDVATLEDVDWLSPRTISVNQHRNFLVGVESGEASGKLRQYIKQVHQQTMIGTWSPWVMLMVWASYARPSSSSKIETLTPFGVANE